MEAATDVLTVTLKAAAAITKNRFITATGAVPAAGANVLGVACADAANNEYVPVQALGIGVVEAGGAIVAGAGVSTTATGKADTQNAAEKTVGRALDAAAADGDLIRVLLIPN